MPETYIHSVLGQEWPSYGCIWDDDGPQSFALENHDLYGNAIDMLLAEEQASVAGCHPSVRARYPIKQGRRSGRSADKQQAGMRLRRGRWKAPTPAAKAVG